MKKILILPLLLASLSLAQETVAPTFDESVGSIRGDNHGDYNLVQSWELGYRYTTVGGNQGEYRSVDDFRNGVRLLSGSISINSRDGHGRWFDSFTLNSTGLGNDPYESAVVRLEKNRLYRYDMSWRQNDYFNPGLTTAAGEHLENTVFRSQDHEVTLFPQSWFRLRAGYARTSQDGPILSTTLQFDPQGDAFPLFANLRQGYNEYRIGGEVTLKGFRLTVMRRWEFFREDTSTQLISPITGQATLFGGSANPDGSSLASFASAQPYRGRTPGWLGNLYLERKRLAVNGRVSYSAGRGSFIQNELASGTDRFSNTQNQQVLVTGSGDRPVLTGDLTVTFTPVSRLSITNVTSISDTRMTGNNFFEQVNNATLTSQFLNFQYLGIRLVTNGTDVRYRFSKRFDAFGGFRYSNRLIRSTEDIASPGSPYDGVTAEQTNHLHAGVAGFNWMPLKDLRIHAETEVGRNDNPFTPVSAARYQVIRGRARYAKKQYSLSAGYQENYNNNSVQITAYSSHSRNYTADGTWNAKRWLALDASYARLHLDTAGGIFYFAGSPRATPQYGQESIYISNIHSGHLSARIPVTSRADLSLGYSIVRDAGVGPGAGQVIAVLSPTPPVILPYVQTFPLTYQTPFLRLSLRITDKLRWNVGWQYYGYKEDFGVLGVNENYRAQTGYTSLLWSF